MSGEARGSVITVKSDEVMTLGFKLRRSSFVLAVLCSLAVLGAACQPRTSDEAQRLKKIESTVTELPGVVARLKTLEGKEGGMSSQLSTLQTQVTDLEAKIADFEQEVDSSRGASQELKKKADDLGGRISAVSAKVDALGAKIAPLDQKVSLLQTRYDDHLRKYHSDG